MCLVFIQVIQDNLLNSWSLTNVCNLIFWHKNNLYRLRGWVCGYIIRDHFYSILQSKVFSPLIPFRLSALSSAAWEMRPFRLHDFCLCLFCLCLWSVSCLLFVWMTTAGLWAPCGQGNLSILKRNSLFGCVVLGLTGADFEQAEWFFWREGTVAGLALSAPVFATFPFQLLSC